MDKFINFEDFSKIDIRVATIKEAYKMEKSEKLLRLVVDLGEELGEKQVLSGIAQSYDYEDLPGRQVIVVMNLEPRKMMGMDSEGMILACGEEEISLLMPDKKINNGLKVR